MKRVFILFFVLTLGLVRAGWVEEKAVPEGAEAAPTEGAEALTEALPEDDSASAVEPGKAAEAPAAAPAEASAPSEEVPAPPVIEAKGDPTPASPATHRVVRGDTLWALAGSYLKNPFLWTRIFQANQDQIKDPHWIFPDQVFVIPTREAAAVLAAPAAEAPAAEAPVSEPEPAVAKAPEATAQEVAPEAPSEEPGAEVAAAQAEDMDVEKNNKEKGLAMDQDLNVEAPEDELLEEDATKEQVEASKKRSLAVPGAGFMGGVADSFLADENWEYDGYVLRDRDQRLMISQGDVVFLNIGATSGVKPKMVANVYRVGKKVRDPFLKKRAGRMVKRVGAVMVTGAVTEEGCTAVVTGSLEPIRTGDIVKFIAR